MDTFVNLMTVVVVTTCQFVYNSTSTVAYSQLPDRTSCRVYIPLIHRPIDCSVVYHGGSSANYNHSTVMYAVL